MQEYFLIRDVILMIVLAKMTFDVGKRPYTPTELAKAVGLLVLIGEGAILALAN